MEKLVFKGIESIVISENIVYYIYDVRKLDITLAGKKLRDKSIVYLYTADEGDVQINIIGSNKSIDTSSMTNGKCYKLIVNATSDIDFEELNEANEGGGGATPEGVVRQLSEMPIVTLNDIENKSLVYYIGETGRYVKGALYVATELSNLNDQGEPLVFDNVQGSQFREMLIHYVGRFATFVNYEEEDMNGTYIIYRDWSKPYNENAVKYVRSDTPYDWLLISFPSTVDTTGARHFDLTNLALNLSFYTNRPHDGGFTPVGALIARNNDGSFKYNITPFLQTPCQSISSDDPFIYHLGIGTLDLVYVEDYIEEIGSKNQSLEGGHFYWWLEQVNYFVPAYFEEVLSKAQISSIVISTTYEELVNKKQYEELRPGMKYRITDYQTVANKNSITTNWRYMFDIVVTAIDNKTLSEDAEICLHELTEQEQEDEVMNYLSDDYNLGMWKIKYTLDYHTSYWYDRDLPDSPTYKGLIYMMRDFNGIEMAYDFWNLPNGLQDYQSWATDSFYKNIVIKAANTGDMPTVSFPHPDGSRPGNTRDVFVDEGCSDIIISGANSNINIGRNCSGIHTESLRDSVIMDGAKNLTLTGGNYGETTNITYKVVIMGLDYEDIGTSQPTSLAVSGSKDYVTYIGKNSQGVIKQGNLMDLIP